MGSFLDKPKTEQEVHSVEGNGLRAGLAAMQGWRVDMEDAHVMIPSLSDHPDYSFYGVFDGHGGKLIAERAAKDLLDSIQATNEWKTNSTDVNSLKAAMRQGFVNLDLALKELPDIKHNDDHSGSTAITVLITPTHFLIANCGDSRAIGISKGAAIAFSEDHKPYNEGESKRIIEAGGTVQMKRVNGDLAVSRALGDYVYKHAAHLPPEKQQVSCEPDILIYERRRADDQFIVLACDGIWDVMSNEECAKLIMEWTLEGAAGTPTNPLLLSSLLIEKGLALQSRDNMSAVIIALPAVPVVSPAVVEAYEAHRAATRTAENSGHGGSGVAGA